MYILKAILIIYAIISLYKAITKENLEYAFDSIIIGLFVTLIKPIV